MQQRPPQPGPDVFRRRRLFVARIAGGFVLTVALLTALWIPGFVWESRADDVNGAVSDTSQTYTANGDAPAGSDPDPGATDVQNTDPQNTDPPSSGVPTSDGQGSDTDSPDTYSPGAYSPDGHGADAQDADALRPAAREGETTALLEAMPDRVLDFVQMGISPGDAWMDEHDAGEAWTIWYTDAVDNPAVRLDVGQWAGQSQAESFAQAQMLVAGTSIRSGDVRVGSSQVGTYALFAQAEPGLADTSDAASSADADAELGAGAGGHSGGGDGAVGDGAVDDSAVLWWRNGTAVFRLIGPADVIQALYVAFPF